VPIIEQVGAREILDSRGNPTVEVEVALIDGTFARVSVRSVPRQSPPYPTLAEAIATQRVTQLRDIPGTMVGFCFPDGLAGIEILGSHLHFACHQRQRGGHVLDYTVRDATVHLGWRCSCLYSGEGFNNRILVRGSCGTNQESPAFRFKVWPSRLSFAVPEIT